MAALIVRSAFLARPHICGALRGSWLRGGRRLCLRMCGCGDKGLLVLVRATSLPVDAEESDAGQQMLGLARKRLRRGRHLFGRTRILLDHLVELLDGLVHLIGADILLAAGRADLLHELGGLLDVGHELRQHGAGFAGGRDGLARQRA